MLGAVLGFPEDPQNSPKWRSGARLLGVPIATNGPVLLPQQLHLGLVIVLMFVFPISKLLHAPGLFFSPTRNQVDNPRERRHMPAGSSV